MDVKKLLDGLEQAIEIGKNIAGPAAALGVPGAALGKAVLEIAENLRQRVEDGTVVATSEDKEQVVAIIEKVKAENAALDDYIRNS